MWKVSKFLLQKQLLTMYHACVQSKLQYLVSIWGAASETRLKSLQVIQNRCLKTVYRKPRLYATLSLYQESAPSIIPIPALRELQCVTQIQNILFNPTVHHNQVLLQVTHTHSLRNSGTLVIERPNSELVKRSVGSFGKSRYNALPISIKQTRILARFKSSIRQHLKNQLENYIL